MRSKAIIISAALLALLYTQGRAGDSHASDSLVAVKGSGCFTYGDDDTPASAREKALSMAKRTAVEGYKSFVSSNTSIRNMELKSDSIDTIATGALYNIAITAQEETGRELCVSITAEVDPEEMDALLAAAIAAGNEPRSTGIDGASLSGRWMAESEGGAHSTLISSDQHSASWQYTIDDINDDTYASVSLQTLPMDMKGRSLHITVESVEGHPLYLTLYSFVPGISDPSDSDTLVPAEIFLPLSKGRQVLDINVAQMEVPRWWREEYKLKDAVFNPTDIRMLELDAEVDEDLGPLSDTVRVINVRLK